MNSVDENMALVLTRLDKLTTAYKNIAQAQKQINVIKLKNGKIRNTRTAVQVVRRHITDFFNNISLPGIRYMGDTGRFDRYVWVFILILSIYVTSKYIEEAYKKWQESPVLLSFNDSLTPISLIPFPAVTLCPPSQLSWRYNLSDSLQRCHEEQSCNYTEWSQFQAARLLCPMAFTKLYNYYFRVPNLQDNFPAHIKEVVSHCKDHMKKITFPDAGDLPCRLHLQTVFVDEKVCFTFNMLRADDLFRDNVNPPVIDHTLAASKSAWTPDLMLESADLYDTVPRHVDTNGERDQLVFVMNNYSDNQRTACQHPYINAKIAFHNPAELPMRRTHKFYSVPLERNVIMRLTPHLVTAEDKLLKYPPDKRKCHFSTEVKLALFKVYTQRNCQTECYINCTLSVCGCIPFYMPRLNNKTTLCSSLLDRRCIQVKLQGLIRDLWWQSSRPSQETYKNKIKVFYTECICDCPADCTTLQYDADVEELTERDQYSLDYGGHSLLRISFQDYEFTSVVRKELIGLTDFIANSGGVLGVFTGFSFVALVELMYYLTLRVWTTIKQAWDDELQEESEEEITSDQEVGYEESAFSEQTVATV